MKEFTKEFAEKTIDEIRKSFEQDLNDLENTVVKCGIIGRSGVGKSSTINAIAGVKIAQTGSTEQTMEAQEFHYENITYVDLPGCGTETFKKDEYIQEFRLFDNDYDCFIVITDNRVYEDDVYLYNNIVEEGYPCFFVRNKIDNAIENEKHDNNLSENEVIEKIRTYVVEKTKSEKVYLISARHPQQWDFPTLIDDILASFDNIKRKTIVRGLNTLTEEILEEKKQLALEIATKRAYLAAINGLNPIPGLDVSVDIGILYELSTEIIKLFGLTEEHLKYFENNTNISSSPTYSGTKQTIIKFGAQYATKEGIVLILKRFATTETVKEFGKFIPFIGQAISAGIGYKMTIWFTEDFIEEASKLSQEILKESMVV